MFLSCSVRTILDKASPLPSAPPDTFSFCPSFLRPALFFRMLPNFVLSMRISKEDLDDTFRSLLDTEDEEDRDRDLEAILRGGLE